MAKPADAGGGLDAPLPPRVRIDCGAQPDREPSSAELAWAVEGRVLNHAGMPVANAQIEVETLGAVEHGRSWRIRSELEGSSDAEGSFRVVGEQTVEWVALRPRHRDHTVGARVVCLPGATDVSLELEQAGALTGQLDLPPGVDAAWFEVSASPREGGASVYRASLSARGRFEVGSLPAAVYDLRVTLLHEPSSAVTIEAVGVQRGAVTDVGTVALGGPVSTVKLRVHAGDGQPPPLAFVRRRPPTTHEFGSSLQPVRDGELTLATRFDCLDLRVEAPGHRSEELLCVAADAEVVLQPALVVRLVLEDVLPARRRELRFGASLEARGIGSMSSARLAVFDERGIAEASVAGPGAYDLRLYVWRRMEDGEGDLVSNRIEATLAVDEDRLGQTFGVRLSRDTMDRLAALGG